LRTGRRAAGRRTRWSASRSSACRTSTTTLTRSSGFFFFCIVFKFIDNDVHEMILAAPREGVRLEILCYGDIQ
jgi:hypothetical protein